MQKVPSFKAFASGVQEMINISSLGRKKLDELMKRMNKATLSQEVQPQTINNLMIVKEGIDTIKKTSKTYIVEKACRIERRLESEARVKTTMDKLEIWRDRIVRPTALDEVRQKQMIESCRINAVSKDCVKELKDVQNLKKISYQYNQRVEEREKEDLAAKVKLRNRIERKSEALGILSQIRGISDDFIDILDKGAYPKPLVLNLSLKKELKHLGKITLSQSDLNSTRSARSIQHLKTASRDFIGSTLKASPVKTQDTEDSTVNLNKAKFFRIQTMRSKEFSNDDPRSLKKALSNDFTKISLTNIMQF